MNETKYEISNGKLVKRKNGEPLPDDEPVFILRASDKRTLYTLHQYANVCKDNDHRNAVIDRIAAFAKFSTDHPERMKEPDSGKYE